MRVYLIAGTAMTDGMECFLDDRGLRWDENGPATDAERVVEAAGRVCYMSFGERQHRKSNAEYVAHLIRQGHDSVLEHASFTVLADGLSRALTHQLVRHRIGFSYSQLSQQYHDESEAEFAEPPLLHEGSTAQLRWRAQVAQARETYQALLRESVADAARLGLPAKEQQRLARSIARSVLPNATATTLVVTGNARAWRHLLTVRGAIAGDLEMRAYCVQTHAALSAAAPHLFADFGVENDAVGPLLRLRANASS